MRICVITDGQEYVGVEGKTTKEQTIKDITNIIENVNVISMDIIGKRNITSTIILGAEVIKRAVWIIRD